jgi:hypothetical protein
LPDTREQIALRFPPGTRARIERLRLPRETLTAVLLRGLDALEQPPQADPDPSPLDALEARVAALEARLDGAGHSGHDTSRRGKMIGKTRQAASRQTPKQRPGDYPPEVREMAARMKMDGLGNAEICAAIRERCGRAPNRKNATSVIRRWIEQLTGEGSGA